MNSIRLAAYGVILAVALGAGALLGSAVGSPETDTPPQESASHSPAAHDAAEGHGGEHR